MDDEVEVRVLLVPDKLFVCLALQVGVDLALLRNRDVSLNENPILSLARDTVAWDTSTPKLSQIHN
jgi:hypothetical protein